MRMKTMYSSRFARSEPAHILYPRPYVNIGASGCSIQRSGLKFSGSCQTSPSVGYQSTQLTRKSKSLPILQAQAFKKCTVPFGITTPSYVISLIDTRGKARRRTVKYLRSISRGPMHDYTSFTNLKHSRTSATT